MLGFQHPESSGAPRADCTREGIRPPRQCLNAWIPTPRELRGHLGSQSSGADCMREGIMPPRQCLNAWIPAPRELRGPLGSPSSGEDCTREGIRPPRQCLNAWIPTSRELGDTASGLYAGKHQATETMPKCWDSSIQRARGHRERIVRGKASGHRDNA